MCGCRNLTRPAWDRRGEQARSNHLIWPAENSCVSFPSAVSYTVLLFYPPEKEGGRPERSGAPLFASAAAKLASPAGTWLSVPEGALLPPVLLPVLLPRLAAASSVLSASAGKWIKREEIHSVVHLQIPI